MTSKEATAYLPRALEGTGWHQPLRDRLAVSAFALVQWPWLLRGLWGGDAAHRLALMERLGLAPDALPNLGSWKADAGFLTLLADHVRAERPSEVVEFGAGASTLVLARALELAGGGRLTSYDQHEDYVEATRAWLAEHGLEADLRVAPLRPGPRWRGLWYAADHLPERIDLLVVDGPQWTLHPMTRGAADTLFPRVAPGGVIMLDDAARPGERLVAARWRRVWPDFAFELVKAGPKGTLVGRRRG
jgi:predicted O-methyltransferase YrrM